MDIKALLAKLARGEALTDEEKTDLSTFDPDKVANSAAAAARKKSEQELKAAKDRVTELEAEVSDKSNEGKTELEKLQKMVEKLTKTVADKDAVIQKGETERKKSIRDGRIGKILSGIKLMDGVDPELARLALERSFADVDDDGLENEGVYKPILDQFSAKNKALILGDQGGGNGTPPKNGAGGGAAGMTLDSIKGMSDADFLKNKDSIWANADKLK